MPPATQALILANVAVYLLELSSGFRIVGPFGLWPFGEGFAVWQLVTYSFLHGGLAHIFFNMFALYMFGSDLERLWGPRFYLAYYFVCVVTAALCNLAVLAWMGGAMGPTIGASGGVFGLLLAFGIYFPRRTVMLIFPPIPMPARVFVFGYGALELILGVTGTMQGVAHFAHLGGMLGGWLMILYRRKRLPWGRR